MHFSCLGECDRASKTLASKERSHESLVFKEPIYNSYTQRIKQKQFGHVVHLIENLSYMISYLYFFLNFLLLIEFLIITFIISEKKKYEIFGCNLRRSAPAVETSFCWHVWLIISQRCLFDNLHLTLIYIFVISWTKSYLIGFAEDRKWNFFRACSLKEIRVQIFSLAFRNAMKL